MPNWCSNQLTVSGDPEKIRAMLDAATLEGSPGKFHLKAIYPCPESLANAQSGSEEDCYEIVHGDWKSVARRPWLRKKHGEIDSRDKLIELYRGIYKDKDLEAIADKYKHNIDTYGFRTWYEWCNRRWGTKWDINADYDYEVGDEVFTSRFDSAWSPPVAAFEHISTLFPSLSFTLEYFEEGCDFMGIVKLEDGEIVGQAEGQPSSEFDRDRFDFAPEPYEDDEEE